MIRRKQRFEYHCLESEDSADAELWHRTHQEVAVLHQLSDVNEVEVGKMYRVRFADGFEGDVFADELMTTTNKFYCPSYLVDRGIQRICP